MVKPHYEEGIDVTSADAVLQCVVVTPEATVLRCAAQFVALPLYDGEIGLLPGRSPLIGRLGFGEMRVVEGDRTMRYYVDGGFVQVIDERVYVITPRAVPADSLDPAVAAEQLATAVARPARSPEQMAARDRATTQARAMLRVAQRAAK